MVTTTGLFPRITHMCIQGMLSIGGATDHVARSDEAFELGEVNLELVHIRLSWRLRTVGKADDGETPHQTQLV